MEALNSITSHHRHRGATEPLAAKVHQRWICAVDGESVCRRNFKSATICSFLERTGETRNTRKKPESRMDSGFRAVDLWWRIPDSNRGPADYDSVALTG